jgi:hypothetical protein
VSEQLSTHESFNALHSMEAYKHLFLIALISIAFLRVAAAIANDVNVAALIQNTTSGSIDLGKAIHIRVDRMSKYIVDYTPKLDLR